MALLKKGDTIGIVACSNGILKENNIMIENLILKLKQLGVNCVISPKLYRENLIYNGTNKEKAEILNSFYKDTKIKAIFDVSGGDASNGILEYINYECVKNNPKPFFGYSDLTVILNALYTKTEVPGYLYQIRNIIGANEEQQTNEFEESFFYNKDSILKFEYEWIQGQNLKGIVVGGNIRCFLKLAGTEYMPDFKDKILFLESLSGDAFKMNTFLNQYKHMGVFKKIKGIILGTFTEMEKNKIEPDIIEILKSIIEDKNMPIIKTKDIGHGQNSKAIIIGKEADYKRI